MTDNEKSEARKFAQDLDRRIGGETAEAGSEKEYDRDMQFAGKMLESRAEPSGTFKNNLKERLLSQMVEQEVRAENEKQRATGFWETFRNLLSAPAARAVTVTAVVAVIALAILWRAGIFYGQTQPPLGAPPPVGISHGPVTVGAVASQATYELGEPVSVVFTFKNTSEEELTLTPFPPEIIIAAISLRPYKTIPGGESQALLPGETVQYTMTWDQRDNDGQQVPVGDYIIEMLDIQLSGGQGTVTLPDSPRISIVAENPVR